MYTVGSRIFDPPRETKIGSGVKLQCSAEESETTFGSSYRAEVRKNEGSRNQDSTVDEKRRWEQELRKRFRFPRLLQRPL